MKIYIFLLVFIVFISQSVCAQYDQRAPQDDNAYVGKWQEYQRSYDKRGRDLADFNDAMQLQFMPDSMVRIWYSSGKYFNEKYQFNRKGVRFGEQLSFGKHWLNGDELILRNEDVYQFFKRVENLQQGAIKKIVPGAERGQVNSSPSHLIGKWSSYKKEDKAFTGKKFYLKTLEVLEENEGQDNYKVKLSMANRSTIKGFEGVMNITNARAVFTLKDETIEYEVLKLENNEMLLSIEGAVIYLKEFTR